MSLSRTSSIAFALITSLLSRTFGVVSAARYAAVSKSTVALLLREECLWNDQQIIQRARRAPSGAYLAFDFVINPHFGQDIEGLDYHYAGSEKSSVVSHRFASCGLVSTDHEPVPLQLKYEVSKNLPTEAYPYRTASQILIAQVKEIRTLGIEFAGVIFDAEFTSRSVLAFSLEAGIGFLGRIKSNCRVKLDGENLNLLQLAERFPFKACHSDHRHGWRSARVPVELDEMKLDILIVYRKQKGVWKPFFLVSTFDCQTTMAELLRAWKARWGIEVIHRLIKQNLGFTKCQSRTIIAHQNWAAIVLEAFIAVLDVKKREIGISWRQAQHIAATEHVLGAVTAVSGNDGFIRAA